VPKIKLNLTKEDQLFQTKLKQLPPYLKYVFLEDGKLVIISNKLSEEEKQKFIKFLQMSKQVIRWTLSDLKGINPSYCTYKILMEETYKPIAQP